MTRVTSGARARPSPFVSCLHALNKRPSFLSSRSASTLTDAQTSELLQSQKQQHAFARAPAVFSFHVHCRPHGSFQRATDSPAGGNLSDLGIVNGVVCAPTRFIEPSSGLGERLRRHALVRQVQKRLQIESLERQRKSMASVETGTRTVDRARLWTTLAGLPSDKVAASAGVLAAFLLTARTTLSPWAVMSLGEMAYWSFSTLFLSP